ncbi:MAG: septum formation initiator family protein, partial [Pseudomonadota bacterium]|nr:septum formation initiator family protein [Pseudomonadota bacterium]
MAFFHEFQKRVRAALWPVAGALMVAYFGYHLVQGNQGLRAWHALDIKIAEAKETRDALAARRALIEG